MRGQTGISLTRAKVTSPRDRTTSVSGQAPSASFGRNMRAGRRLAHTGAGVEEAAFGDVHLHGMETSLQQRRVMRKYEVQEL